MGSLPIQGRLLKADEGATQQYSSSDYHPKSESPTELYPKPLSLQHQHSYPYLHPFHPQQKGRPVELDRRSLPFHSRDFGISQAKKTWASSVDLACIDPEALRFGALEDARRGSSAISTHTTGRHKSPLPAPREKEFHYSEFGGLKNRKPYHFSASSVGSGAYDRIKERQRKLQALQQAVDGEYAFLSLRCIEPYFSQRVWFLPLLHVAKTFFGICTTKKKCIGNWSRSALLVQNVRNSLSRHLSQINNIPTEIMLWLLRNVAVRNQWMWPRQDCIYD